MIDLKNIEMNLITVDSENFNVNEFYKYIDKVEVCMAFMNFDKFMLDDLFINAGFTKIKGAESPHYFKIMDSFIFVIDIEPSAANFVMREKYFLNYSERNLSLVKAFIHKTFNDGNFTDFHSDSELYDYKLYPESLDMPFYVNYLVRSAYAVPKLLRVDLGLKYGNDKFMIASIFDRDDECIQISYDTYTRDCNYMYAEFIQFVNENVTDLKIYTPHNQKTISITHCLDDCDIDLITLDNYHLFWEKLTSEQILLFEMSVV